MFCFIFGKKTRTIASCSYSAVPPTRMTRSALLINDMMRWALYNTQPALNIKWILAHEAVVNRWTMTSLTDWMTLKALVVSILISCKCAIRTLINASEVMQHFSIWTAETVVASWTITSFAVWMAFYAFVFQWVMPLRTKWGTHSCTFVLNQILSTSDAICDAWPRTCFTCWMAFLTKTCGLIRKCSIRTLLFARKTNKTFFRMTTCNAVISSGSYAPSTWWMTFDTLLKTAIQQPASLGTLSYAVMFVQYKWWNTPCAVLETISCKCTARLSSFSSESINLLSLMANIIITITYNVIICLGMTQSLLNG